MAIIGGTGVYDPGLLEDLQERTLVTPFGAATIAIGRYQGEEIGFLARHGRGHSVPPHRINYRANIWALKELGAERVLATTAVGSLRRDLAPGTLVLCDQFLDFTKSRPTTFFDGGEGGVVHVDVTHPYCGELRGTLEAVGGELALPVVNGGTYVCVEGPRFETAAEIRMYGGLGGDVVGMTGVPEVVLARELGLCYTTLSMVVNLGAGLSDQPLTHSEVTAVMNANVANLRRLIMGALPRMPRERSCACGILPEHHGQETEETTPPKADGATAVMHEGGTR